MNTPQMLGLILAWCFIAAGSWLVWQLVKQNGRILLRLDELEKRLDELTFGEENKTAGLPLDSTAPEFSLPDLNGNHRRLAEYRGQRLLLIFFNPECGFCRDMMPKLTAV